MTQAWSNFVIADPNCTCCNAGGPCFITMPTIPIDGSSTPYADLTTATAALASQAISCLIEMQSGYVGNINASFANTLDTSGAIASPDPLIQVFGFVISTNASGNITSAYTVSTDAGSWALGMTVYTEDGSSTIGSNGSFNSMSGNLSVAISGAGNYMVSFQYSEAPSPNSGTFFNATTSTNAPGIMSCGVRAAYDDGMGGTDYVVCT